MKKWADRILWGLVAIGGIIVLIPIIARSQGLLDDLWLMIAIPIGILCVIAGWLINKILLALSSGAKHLRAKRSRAPSIN